MCERYVCIQKVETLEKRFNVTARAGFEFRPSYNISPGKYVPVITNEKPKELQLFRFGMTPFQAKKKMNLFNARTEGDRNMENDEHYTGARTIITKPEFRKPVRQQRCLVIADAFIVGSERFNKPYLVYLRDNVRPFAFAGIWDEWVDEGGEILFSFAIITTVCNSLIKKTGANRSPVILSRGKETKWLNSNLPLTDVTSFLEPYPAELMNAYPIANTIKSTEAEGKHLIEPIGPKIQPESNSETYKPLKMNEMWPHQRNI